MTRWQGTPNCKKIDKNDNYYSFLNNKGLKFVIYMHDHSWFELLGFTLRSAPSMFEQLLIYS